MTRFITIYLLYAKNESPSSSNLTCCPPMALLLRSYVGLYLVSYIAIATISQLYEHIFLSLLFSLLRSCQDEAKKQLARRETKFSCGGSVG